MNMNRVQFQRTILPLLLVGVGIGRVAPGRKLCAGGGVTELVTDEGCVEAFFEPEGAGSMADAIEQVLTNPDARREMCLHNYHAA